METLLTDKDYKNFKQLLEYFVSYYDYYQPEAYIPHTDTYISSFVEASLAM